MRELDLSLYLVLDSAVCGTTQDMLDCALAAVKGGVTLVQLRAKNLNKRQFYQAACQLKIALDKVNIPLIINDQIDIALAVDASGVHVGQSDLPADIARNLIGQNKWLGLSIANAEQLSATPSAIVDYIGVGPVFSTSSKADAEPALGLRALSELMQQKTCPAVAIGGINRQNAAEVILCGVDGIAVVSAICGQQNPMNAALDLYNIALKKKVQKKDN